MASGRRRCGAVKRTWRGAAPNTVLKNLTFVFLPSLQLDHLAGRGKVGYPNGGRGRRAVGGHEANAYVFLRQKIGCELLRLDVEEIDEIAVEVRDPDFAILVID